MSASAEPARLACVPFTAEQVPAAATAAAAAAARLHARLPVVPARWSDPAAHVPILEALARDGSGWVGLRDGRYAGHHLARHVADPGAPRTYAPEPGLAVAPGIAPRAARRVVEELVATACAAWVGGGLRTHAVSVAVDEAAVREALAWLGYGMLVVDALRPLDDEALGALPAAPPAGCRVRRAGPEDLAAVLELDRGLRRHLVTAPTFLVLGGRQDPARIAARLADPATATFVAEEGPTPLAFLRVGPPGDDIATLVRDDATASIDGAFTVADRRGSGVAAALLGAAARWARERGAVRLGVDFEAANLLAARFWTRWFTPVTVAYLRRLDPRAGTPAASPDPEDLPGTAVP
jgi:GNAT superfamily N-acetyltransferase